MSTECELVILGVGKPGICNPWRCKELDATDQLNNRSMTSSLIEKSLG